MIFSEPGSPKPARDGVGDGQTVVEVPRRSAAVLKDVKVKEGEKIKGRAVILPRAKTLRPTSPPRSGPVEHASDSMARVRPSSGDSCGKGKTEEQALPPDQPHQTVPPSACPLSWQVAVRDIGSGSCRAARSASRARGCIVFMR